MARPLKNNADYFSHDADMRNDIRIKALRRKFGHVGYSIYNMMLETLTDASDFRLKFDELNIEMLSGDFDIDPHELNDVIDYLLKIELMQSESGFIRCFTLENRFESLLSKRKRDRNRVIADENTQSKVKESKVKESKVNDIKNDIFLKIENHQYFEMLYRYFSGKYKIDEIHKHWETFKQECELSDDLNRTATDYKRHFQNTLKKKLELGTNKSESEKAADVVARFSKKIADGEI